MNDSLNKSKTLWGFGVALGLFVVKVVLDVFFGIEISEPIFSAVIEIVQVVAAFFGIYGVRDALRKLKFEK